MHQTKLRKTGIYPKKRLLTVMLASPEQKQPHILLVFDTATSYSVLGYRIVLAENRTLAAVRNVGNVGQ